MFKRSLLVSALVNLQISAQEFSTDSYIALSGAEKQDKIWEKVIEDTSSGQWTSIDVFFSDMKKTFGSPGDEMFCKSDGKCRTKTLHNVGSVAKIKWVSEDTAGHPFTGLFKGSDTGIIRFSTGSAPSGSGITPGIGIKLLRDGIDSGNLVAMKDIDGQVGFDIFQEDFETHLPANSINLGKMLAGFKFSTASSKI